MAETKKAEVTSVQLTDGRTVNFAGKRKVNKETLIDESKIVIDGDVIQMQAQAVGIRMDFRNGETRTYYPPLSLYARFLGHGGEQKYGDELAASASDPMSEDDMVLATDDLDHNIQQGNWGKGRASGGGGVSGASIVVRAILEDANSRRGGDTGKRLFTVEDIKAFLQKKLDSTPDLTRRALYDSYRVPGTAVATIIERLEKEKTVKVAKVDVAAVSEELDAEE